MRSDMSCSRMASKLCGCNGSWSLVLLDAQPGDAPGLGIESHGHWGNLGRLGIIRYGNMRDDVGFTILNNGFHIYIYTCFHVCHVLQYHVVQCCTMLYIVVPYLGRFERFEHL